MLDAQRRRHQHSMEVVHLVAEVVVRHGIGNVAVRNDRLPKLDRHGDVVGDAEGTSEVEVAVVLVQELLLPRSEAPMAWPSAFEFGVLSSLVTQDSQSPYSSSVATSAC